MSGLLQATGSAKDDAAPDGLRIVYGGQEVLGRTDLFLVEIDGE